MSVNKKIAKQCLSLSSVQVEVPLALCCNPSTGHCLTAVLANGPLANYHCKDCQSDAGVSPIFAVTLTRSKKSKRSSYVQTKVYMLTDIC